MSGERRPAYQHVLFHAGGAAATVVALAVGLYAMVIASFGTSVCNDPDHSQELRGLRIALLVVGALVALAPLGWALVARATRFAWRPWAAVAALLVLGAVAAAAGTHDVSTWCF